MRTLEVTRGAAVARRWRSGRGRSWGGGTLTGHSSASSHASTPGRGRGRGSSGRTRGRGSGAGAGVCVDNVDSVGARLVIKLEEEAAQCRGFARVLPAPCPAYRRYYPPDCGAGAEQLLGAWLDSRDLGMVREAAGQNKHLL